MFFRYRVYGRWPSTREGGKETHRKRVFTASDRVSRDLCAIALIVVICTIGAATTAIRCFQVTLSQSGADTELQNSLPFVLHAKSVHEDQSLVRFKLKVNGTLFLALSRNEAYGTVYIQDVVLLPDEVLLLLRLPSSMSKLAGRSLMFCVFSDRIHTEVSGIEHLPYGRAAVRCKAPPQGSKWSASRISILDTSALIAVKFNQINAAPRIAIKWDFMVYETFSTDADVVLFAKGVNRKQGLNVNPESLRCVFDGAIETIVTVSAQEVFRCDHPQEEYRSHMVGTKISLRVHGEPIPSVAYYQLPDTASTGSERRNKINDLCACTMVYNVGKFLNEWIMYHSHLGVSQFFLYDNNSEDNLEETVASLGKYNITRHPWPWVKTQEAGFSHCALNARNRCQWMLYADVDEFVFSPTWLLPNPESRNPRDALKSLVTKRNNLQVRSAAPTGQISIKCRNFGPSGQKTHPERGVTQGYTCRQRFGQRHKSILLLHALPASLLNVVHHFQLKRPYATEHIKASEAVINHYKYQAWTEFKSKFRRRVSAYVADWKESRNSGSQDRTPGLGNEAIEPPGWENKFCDLNDTALRDFTSRMFSSGSKMLWQM